MKISFNHGFVVLTKEVQWFFILVDFRESSYWVVELVVLDIIVDCADFSDKNLS